MILKQSLLSAIILQCLMLHNKIVYSKKRDEIDENLLQTQCKLIFYEKYSGHINNETIYDCIENIQKPGKCPKSNNNNSIEPMSCLEKCNQHDYKCPGTKKCCQQNCGWICQEPDKNFEFDKNLPPIPFNLSVPTRKHKGRSCDISWQLPINRTDNKSFIVIVEGRSHIGSIFAAHKLGEWQWFQTEIIADSTIKPNIIKSVVRIKLRKGRWYQFRVAAINEYGFKGYSNLSKPYKLSDFPPHITAPKVPQIANFTISQPKLLPNGSVYAKAVWIPEKSDIPIEKYQISWALYLKAENDSLFLSDDYVKEPQRYYEFWNLNINSSYYVQVKAISVHGKRKLKSPKEPFILNTTFSWNNANNWNHNNNNNNNNRNNKQQKNLWISTSLINSTGYTLKNSHKKINYHHSNINYKFIPNKKYGILVRIYLNKESFSDKYLLEICPGTTTDCETKEYEAAKAKKDHIDFSQIKFQKDYTLRLIDINSTDKTQILWSKTFKTPSCENWLKRYNSLGINC